MMASVDHAPWSPSTLAAGAELAALARADVDLGPFCTYRVGGPAAFLVEVADDEQLDLVAAAVARTGTATLVIGKGSNLLVADRGFDGLVVLLGPHFATIDLPEAGPDSGSDSDADSEPVAEPDSDRLVDGDGDDRSVIVTLGGAALLPVAARATARAGLTGFEWAVGVPGSVGGAVRMNAGGHGADMSDSLVSVDFVDLASGHRSTRSVDDLDLGYRTSNISASEIVTSARIRLHPGTGAEEDRLAEIVRWRRQHQPGGANAGSVFANPPGDSAGRLIDAAGLKGHRIGSASVSTKHANFIQVDSPGSADDVAALIDEVIRRIEQDAGVRLHPENRLIGFAPSTPRRDRATTVDDA